MITQLSFFLLLSGLSFARDNVISYAACEGLTGDSYNTCASNVRRLAVEDSRAGKKATRNDNDCKLRLVNAGTSGIEAARICEGSNTRSVNQQPQGNYQNSYNVGVQNLHCITMSDIRDMYDRLAVIDRENDDLESQIRRANGRQNSLQTNASQDSARVARLDKKVMSLERQIQASKDRLQSSEARKKALEREIESTKKLLKEIAEGN